MRTTNNVLLSGTAVLQFFPDHQERAGDENRAISTDKDANHQSQSKILDCATAEQKDREQGKDGRQRGINGTGDGLVDAAVDGVLKIFMALRQVLTNTVENDNRIADAITEHRQDSGNKWSIDLNAVKMTEHGKDAEGKQDIMNQGDNRGDAIFPRSHRAGNLAESKRDIDDNHHKNDCYRIERFAF